MTADEFMTNMINAYDDWGNDERERWQKKQLTKFVSENYTDDERAELWDLVEKSCERRPRIAMLNKLKPGKWTSLIYRRKKATPNYDYGEIGFTTEAAKRFAEQLSPIFNIKISGDITQEEYLTEEQRGTMKSRSMTFFEILNKLMEREKLA